MEPTGEQEPGSAAENYMEQTQAGYDDQIVYDYDYSYLDILGFARLPEAEASDFLYMYICPAILLVAVFSNVVTALIMFKMSFKVVSTCAHLSLLSVVDLLVLCITCGNDWLSMQLGYSLTHVLMMNSDVYCRTYAFVERFICHLSRWLVITVMLDGFIVTRFPEKSSRWVTLFRARTTILLLTLALSLLNIHFFWTYMMMESKEKGYTSTHCGFVKFGIAYNKQFQVTIWPLLDLAVNDLLPFIIVTACTIVIFTNVCKKKQSESEVPAENTDAAKSDFYLQHQSTEKMKIALACLGVFFFVFNTPNLVWKIRNKYSRERIFPKSENTGIQESYDAIDYSEHSELEDEFNNAAFQKIQDQLITTCMSILWYLFLSSKMFLYLAALPKFRAEFKGLFCCQWCVKTYHRYHKVSTSTSKKQQLVVDTSSSSEADVEVAPETFSRLDAKSLRQTSV